MNDTIEKMLEHHSVRNFKDQALTQVQKNELIRAAQSGASSNFLQAYSILEISDLEKRQHLGKLANCLDYVSKTGVFYIFVADLYRHATILKENQQAITPLQSPESLMVSIVDTTIAAQNMALAAESMGLGICYIGGIRNDLFDVANLLELPELTVPLFGLTIGVPNEANEVKPRMALDTITSENTYSIEKLTDMTQYDETIRQYYSTRTTNTQQASWSEKSLNYFSTDRRPTVKTFLQKQGFDL